MPSPFPGMDPYLENPQEWPEVHNRLIVNLADWLSPQLRPTYRVAIEKRTYQTDVDDFLLVGLPDVTVLSPKSSTPSSQLARSILRTVFRVPNDDKTRFAAYWPNLLQVLQGS